VYSLCLERFFSLPSAVVTQVSLSVRLLKSSAKLGRCILRLDVSLWCRNAARPPVYYSGPHGTDLQQRTSYSAAVGFYPWRYFVDFGFRTVSVCWPSEDRFEYCRHRHRQEKAAGSGESTAGDQWCTAKRALVQGSTCWRTFESVDECTTETSGVCCSAQCRTVSLVAGVHTDRQTDRQTDTVIHKCLLQCEGFDWNNTHCALRFTLSLVCLSVCVQW